MCLQLGELRSRSQRQGKVTIKIEKGRFEFVDKYKNYAELRADEREGLDFRICVSNRAASVAVIAPVCTENFIRIDWGRKSHDWAAD